jgi:ankyrin repeat protein
MTIKGTELYRAVATGNHTQVASLLAKGVDPDMQRSMGCWSALMYAARNDCRETVQRLLEGGAEVDYREASSGKTALMCAASSRQAKNVELLLKFGASPNIASSEAEATLSPIDGTTALMMAAATGGDEAVEILLRGGADWAMTRGDGMGALDLAEKSGYSRCTDILRAFQQQHDMEEITARACAETIGKRL